MSASVQLKFLKRSQDLTDEQRFTVAEKLDYTASLVDTVVNYADIQVISGKIHLGGQSTLFVYEFPVTEGLSLVIKIYNPLKTTLERLVLHFLSVEEFNSRVLSFNSAIIKVMPVFALGNLKLPSKNTPFLVQEFSKGIPVSEKITTHRHLLKILRGVFKEMSLKGFIVDPLPTNWFITNLDTSKADKQDMVNLDYIDMLSSNQADSNEIRTSLKNFFGDEF